MTIGVMITNRKTRRSPTMKISTSPQPDHRAAEFRQRQGYSRPAPRQTVDELKKILRYVNDTHYIGIANLDPDSVDAITSRVVDLIQNEHRVVIRTRARTTSALYAEVKQLFPDLPVSTSTMSTPTDHSITALLKQ